MPRYYFAAELNGRLCHDPEGEEFASQQTAEAFARTVMDELSRNNSQPVMVYLLSESGAQLAVTSSADRRSASRNRLSASPTCVPEPR